MESYAPQTNVLRALVRADVFKWEEEHQEAFEALKNVLSADTVLAYFDPPSDHEVHVDGCPLGISATLVQRSQNEEHWRVVQYASRALSDAEPRYSQIELETLAADFACRKFHVFLYGKPFIVVTDHKPLEVIFNNPRHATSIRLQRMTVQMQETTDCTSMLWSIDSCQNGVSADQYYLTVARAQVSTHWGRVFFEVICWQVTSFQMIAGSSLFFKIHMKCVVFMSLWPHTIKMLISNWLRTQKFN